MLAGLFSAGVRPIATGAIMTGTSFGDFNTQPSAAFDGDTDQLLINSARKSSGSTEAYLGLRVSPNARIYKLVTYGTSDEGYIAGTAPSVTIQLRADTSEPSAGSDGTLLGSVTFIDGSATNSQEIDSDDKETEWSHVWARIINNSGDTTKAQLFAELQFIEVN